MPNSNDSLVIAFRSTDKYKHHVDHTFSHLYTI